MSAFQYNIIKNPVNSMDQITNHTVSIAIHKVVKNWKKRIEECFMFN